MSGPQQQVDYLDAFNDWVDAADRGAYFDIIENEIWRWKRDGVPFAPAAEWDDENGWWVYWMGPHGIVYQCWLSADQTIQWVVVIAIL